MRHLICDLCNDRIFEQTTVIKFKRTLLEWLRLRSKVVMQFFYLEGGSYSSGNKFEICDRCEGRLKQLMFLQPNAINELRTYIRGEREGFQPQRAGRPMTATELTRRYAEAAIPTPRINPQIEIPRAWYNEEPPLAVRTNGEQGEPGGGEAGEEL
jgi:hypothetical protein